MALSGEPKSPLNFNMVKFFSICFLLLPWIMIPNDKLADPFRIPKSTFFDFICISLICFSFYHGLRKRYFNKYFSWLAIWLFFIIGINWYLPYTLSFNNRQAINIWILEPMIHLILALWVTYIALSYFEKEDYENISKTICYSSVLLSSVGILQVLGLDIFGIIARYNHPNRFSAFLDNPNILGNYLALSLPFFLIQKYRKYILGFIIVLTGIIFSKSNLSMFTSIIGLLVYLLLILKSYKKIFWCLSSILILLFIVLFSQLKFLITLLGDHRLGLWKMAWIKFKDNPIFGQGIGIVKTWDLKFNDTKWLNLHNDWLSLAIQIGILGIILIILVIINSLKKFNYKENKTGYGYYASFISFLVLMFGSFPLEIAPLALFGLVNWWAVESL